MLPGLAVEGGPGGAGGELGWHGEGPGGTVEMGMGLGGCGAGLAAGDEGD